MSLTKDIGSNIESMLRVIGRITTKPEIELYSGYYNNVCVYSRYLDTSLSAKIVAFNRAINDFCPEQYKSPFKHLNKIMLDDYITEKSHEKGG